MNKKDLKKLAEETAAAPVDPNKIPVFSREDFKAAVEAGQEQRVFVGENEGRLLEKMKEAGYLWNGLTKRLINIKESGYEWDSKNKKYKNIEQKSAWSEDDEKFFKTALWHISYSISNGKGTDIHCDTTEWLKSLKERIIS